MKTKKISLGSSGHGMKRTVLVPSRKEPLTVVIDRRKWYRGKGGDGSRLLTDEGQLCCLGFDAKAIGLKPSDIHGQACPNDAARGIPGLSTDKGKNTKTCRSLMDVNDDTSMKDEDREKKLTSMARRIGRRFVFKN